MVNINSEKSKWKVNLFAFAQIRFHFERTLRIRRVYCGQGTLSDCLTVGATNRSTLRIFVQVVQNVAHCIGGTLNQSQRGGRGAAAAKGPGQEVGGASHGPGHLSKVNKRVDNWARRWSLRAVSEERGGSRGRGGVQESGPSKGISCERSDLISLLNNGATKWQQISFMAQASSAVTRKQARDGPLHSLDPPFCRSHMNYNKLRWGGTRKLLDALHRNQVIKQYDSKCCSTCSDSLMDEETRKDAGKKGE